MKGKCSISLSIALVMILAGGILGVTTNLIHPNGIAWIQDWSRYVESQAQDAGIDVIPLGIAHARYTSGNSLFIDARNPVEYGAGHVPGSISVPFEEFEEYFEELEKVLCSDKEVVVYCSNRECDDALGLAVELKVMGVSNLLYYVDGFELWEASGCPVDKG
jgi:rhodanese-related sulfurtransferase